MQVQCFSFALSFAVLEQRSKTSELLENGLQPYRGLDGRLDGRTDSLICRDEKKTHSKLMSFCVNH